jgi:hypothetical protein
MPVMSVFRSLSTPGTSAELDIISHTCCKVSPDHCLILITVDPTFWLLQDEPFDDQDSPEPSTGRKRMRTQKALAALESDFLLPSWLTGNKADLSQAFQRSQFPNDMFSIPSKYLRKKKLKVNLSKMQNGKKSSMKERRELKQPNRALQQAIKEIPQTMALALADLLSTACFNR